MSSHRRATKYFSRKFNARKALFRGLIVSLVEHGRIKTTVIKAKEIRRHVEKAITLGKKDDLATRRLLMSRIPNETTVNSIMTDISKRFLTRPGGYTRVIKVGRRPGDTAEMAFLEFVDYDWKSASSEKSGKAGKTEGKVTDKEAKSEKTKSGGKTKSTEKAKVAKKTSMSLAAKKKSVRKMKQKSRVEART